jgi:hypothetical protein
VLFSREESFAHMPKILPASDASGPSTVAQDGDLSVSH